MGKITVRRVVIAGLGLIGGSFALALRRERPDLALAGWDEEAVLVKGLARGVIDAVCRPEDLVDGDLLVLAAPPHASLFLLDSVASLPPSVIVTDVVSTKRVIVDAAIAKGTRFVGGHPMAGSEQSGLDHAAADLFDGKRWFLVDAGAGDEANDAVEAMVASLGARPEWIDALEHDRVMAAISHLPQIAASALMAVAGPLAGESNLDLAGAGLRDTTRLAAGDPELWSEIAASNAEELVKAVRMLREQLERVEKSLDASEPLHEFFSAGRRWRSKL
ncbi:MAG: prephenate dehydrogenase/arogenate dehydrogenase family protein [Acidobacteriota bacterium]|nr:prephenate dehydrogenase/arogenate dehydrogenase family protein [Acidobacteriota bacterium]